jgi:dienelactone hydrolase
MTGRNFLWASVTLSFPSIRFRPEATSRGVGRFKIDTSYRRDAYCGLEYLARQSLVDPKRIAAVGFSMGAITINTVIMVRSPQPAAKPEFKAFGSFYGHCKGLKRSSAREVPLLQIVAELDTQLAPSCIAAAKAVKMDMHLFPTTHHAFDQPQITLRPDAGGNMMLYSADATAKSRTLLRDFLERHLK